MSGSVRGAPSNGCPYRDRESVGFVGFIEFIEFVELKHSQESRNRDEPNNSGE